MTSTDLPRKRRLLFGGIAGLAGVGFIVAALAFPAVTAPEAVPDPSYRTTGPSATTTTPMASPVASGPPVEQESAATASGAVAELPQSPPVRVRIPSIGVDAGTVPLGLDGNELETPEDPDDVGWFVGAQTPGAPGRAVLAGHLTWNGRHTVFASLPELAVGAVVEVDREDGTTARFRITGVETFEKTEFPTDEVYAATEEPSLALITCGGDYSQADHYYDSNVIALAVALDD